MRRNGRGTRRRPRSNGARRWSWRSSLMYMRATAASGSPSCSRYTRVLRITNSKNSKRSTAALTNSRNPSRLSNTYGSRSRRSMTIGMSGTKISSSSAHARAGGDVGVRVLQPAHRDVVDGLLVHVHVRHPRADVARARNPSRSTTSPTSMSIGARSPARPTRTCGTRPARRTGRHRAAARRAGSRRRRARRARASTVGRRR